jgi:hypothetical protein
MRPSRSLVLPIGALVLLAATACGDSSTATEAATDAPVIDNNRYVSEQFAPAVEVTVPAWLSTAPDTDESNFLTWVGTDEHVDRAVRFLLPVEVYEPGSAAATPVPEDYLSYLRSQAAHGARLVDETTTSVDGSLATILTGTTPTTLDKSLGCPAVNTPAPDCFGLHAGLALRLAIIDLGDRTLVVWARVTEDSADAAEVFADFGQMLAGLHLR